MSTIKIGKWDTEVTISGETIMFYHAGKGGAICCGKTFEEAREKYIEMMTIAETLHELFSILPKDVVDKILVRRT